MKGVVAARRLTVFIEETVKYGDTVRAKLVKVLPSPHVGPEQLPPALRPIEEVPHMSGNGSWQMACPGLSYLFHFGNKKIDVTSVSRNEDEGKYIKNMCGWLQKVLKILDIDKVTRMAYAHTVGIDDTESFNAQHFFDSRLPLPDMSGTKPVGRLIAMVYKLGRNMGGEEVKVNYSCQLGEGIRKDGKDNDKCNCLIATIDINTPRDQACRFPVEDITGFATEAWIWSEQFVDTITTDSKI